MDKQLKCIKGGKIILEDSVLEGKIIIFNAKILDIIDEKDFGEWSSPNQVTIIEAQGQYVSPGFIDIHIHGAGGRDTMDGELASLEIISKTIVKSGVTGFLPTTMTMGKDEIFKALASIRLGMKKKINGAKILGAHLEGPFISHNYKGVQNEKYICKPDFNFIKDYTDIIKIITLAPEEDIQFGFIKRVKQTTDIVLSIGHTNADFEMAMEAIKNGISNATHIFNAMPPLHHRNPGALGAILRSDISCELIADNHHIHPAVYQILVDVKGKDKIILVTDSIKATFMKGISWELGGQKVFVKNNTVRLSDGTLAGSVLKLNEAVLNILRNTDLQIYEAVALASLNPAKLIKMDNKKGSIKKGKDADLLIFNKNIDIDMSIWGGNIVYKA